MLSFEENELITQTDRGTPMGEVFRRFWLPALLSEELPGADCNPVRVRMLGEELVAFRDSEGRPGVIDAYCPHRGAPMFFGRNEEAGIRCLYHGWKFDFTGKCIDMPNIPHGETAKNRMRTIAYPTHEAAKMIWVYMGPEDRQPPFPELPFTTATEENVFVTKYELDCNWLQAMEGSLDPTHAYTLHSTLGSNADVTSGYQGGSISRMVMRMTNNPVLIVGAIDTMDGILFASGTPSPDGTMQVVGKHVVLPNFIDNGLTSSEPGIQPMHLRIPIDDTHLMYYRLRWSDRGFTEKEIWEYTHGGFVYPLHIPGTYRAQANVHNDYNVDRVLQRQFNYSGVSTFPVQDQMVNENQWGPLADRTKEHLVAADKEIIFFRQRMLNLAKAYAAGVEPDEPFHMTDIQFKSSTSEPVIVQAGEQVSEEVMTELLARHNTTRLHVTT